MEALEPRRLLSVTINPIAAQNVPGNKSLIIPVKGTDSDGLPLTYTVSTDTGNVTAEVHTGNTFLQLDVANFGTMTLELFNDIAPNTVARITALVNSGFYNGQIFWRVIDNFVIQTGDPTGLGTGGTGTKINNEPNLQAIYSGSGQLAMANGGYDTNDSQFFITEGPQRSLDLKYTIFGQLVRGQNVLTAIEGTPVQAQSASNTEVSRPVTPVTLTSATIVQDTSDAVITVGVTGTDTGNVTVTATDSNNNSSTQTFAVTGVADTVVDPPIITNLNTTLNTPMNTPVTLVIGTADLETGDTIAVLTSSPPTGIASLNDAGSATLLVTPTAGFTGTTTFLIETADGVYTTDGNALSASNAITNGDIETITINVGAALPAVRSGSSLTVTGTNGPDTITIDDANGKITTSVNGVVQSFNDTKITSLTVTGSAGNDTITLGATAMSAIVHGNAGDDTIVGNLAGDSLTGNAGNDSITGLAGADTITGGAGDDTVFAGGGPDSINGGIGNDQLHGGGGNDTIQAGAGTSSLYGGAGDDLFMAVNGNPDSIAGGAGTDTADYSNNVGVVLSGVENENPM
jgi:cyclophilin family peptidyl-prolyl cis-trans isomerase